MSADRFRHRRSRAGRLRAAVPALGAAFVILAAIARSATAQAPGLGLPAELVDPKVFRVCADPNNMPFSDKAQQGFENKIADLFAAQLGKSVAYVWFPQVVGFARRTLNVYRCDVVMGVAQGAEEMQNTNPYYRSAYVMVYRAHDGLDGATTLADKRLVGKRIGVVPRTPPATLMAMDGLMDHAKPYVLAMASDADSSAKDMMADLAAGRIDVALLWGPMAGYYATREGVAIAVVPLAHEQSPIPMAFNITMGVRHSDQAWKRQLNALIAKNRQRIDAILASYGVPLLDNQDQLVKASTNG